MQSLSRINRKALAAVWRLCLQGGETPLLLTVLMLRAEMDASCTHNCDDTWISSSCMMAPGMPWQPPLALLREPPWLLRGARTMVAKQRPPVNHVLQGEAPHMRCVTNAGPLIIPCSPRRLCKHLAQHQEKCTSCCCAAADAMECNPCQI